MSLPALRRPPGVRTGLSAALSTAVPTRCRDQGTTGLRAGHVKAHRAVSPSPHTDLPSHQDGPRGYDSPEPQVVVMVPGDMLPAEEKGVALQHLEWPAAVCVSLTLEGARSGAPHPPAAP